LPHLAMSVGPSTQCESDSAGLCTSNDGSSLWRSNERLDAVWYAVTDWSRAKTFYGDALRLQPTFGMEEVGWQRYRVAEGSPDVTISRVQAGQPGAVREVPSSAPTGSRRSRGSSSSATSTCKRRARWTSRRFHNASYIAVTSFL